MGIELPPTDARELTAYFQRFRAHRTDARGDACAPSDSGAQTCELPPWAQSDDSSERAQLASEVVSGETTRAATQSRKRRACTPPRGSGEAHAGRPEARLPPPHFVLRRKDVEREARRLARTRRTAQLQRGMRDAATLPAWSFLLAHRVKTGQVRSELLALKRSAGSEIVARIERAASYARSEHARLSTISLGLVLTWLSLRSRRRPGRPANLGGVSLPALRKLTFRADGEHYSVSSIAHRTHGKGTRGERVGPRGALGGDPTQGDAGFLELLEHEGALLSWVPPARAVPEWMRGPSGYAFRVFRAPLCASDDPLDLLRDASGPPPS